MRKVLLLMAVLFAGAGASIAQVSVTATAGTTTATSYTTLSAAFTAINAGTHQGAITISITGNTTEPASTVALLKSASPSSYTSISIVPSGGDWTINSAATPSASRGVIELSGADNVTIDGDPTNTGTRHLSIVVATNSSTGTAAVRFSSNSTTGADGADNNTIKNCIITGGRSSATSTTVSYGINMSNYSTSSMTTGAYSSLNTIIQNNLLTRCYYAVYANGNSTTYPNTGLQVINNTIGSSTAASNVGAYGIYLAYTSSGATGAAIVNGNDIMCGDYATGFSTNPSGVYLSTGANNVLISKNKIHDVGNGSINGYGAYGIGIVAAVTGVSIINNFIWDITAQNYSATITSQYQNYGIYISAAATGLTINHNSISLNKANLSTYGTANPVSACIQITSSTAVVSQLLNNIFVNNQGTASTAAYNIITSGTANISGGTVNNNDYYVAGNGKTGYYNSAVRATLTAWQTATGKDGASASVNPPFVSATDLHITGGVSTVLESGGVGVAVSGVNTDIDGDTRPGPAGSINGGGTVPDIGADEFDGVPLDAIGPAISYTILPNTCSTGNVTLSGVTITDVSGVPVTGSLVPRIYYKKSAAGTYYSGAGVLSSGTATNGTWSFTIDMTNIGGVNAGDSVYYYIIAQDIVATPNISSNASGVVATNVNTVTTHPANPNGFGIGTTLSGTYTVGANGTYTTLTAAAAAYNTGCLTGPVTFSLTDASYNESVTINSIPTANSTNTLTIKPATGVTATITASSTAAVIKLNGADYVTIDGSNTVNGISKDLTISNTSTSTSSAVIWIGSANATDGAGNNKIKNLVLVGNGSYTTAAGVIAGSGTTLGNAGEAANSNNAITNCTINTAQNAVFISGNATTNDNGWVISDNTIGSATTAQKLGFRGLAIQNAQNFVINNNTITGIVSSTTSTAVVSGILVGAVINGGIVSNNKINDVVHTNTTGYGANGIYLNTTTTASNVSVINNFISEIKGSGYATGNGANDNGYGIMINSGGGFSIQYNTVSLSVNQTTGNTAAINISSSVTTAASIDIRNNIFANLQTSNTRYAIYSVAANTVFSAIDYNDYYTTGTNLGYIGSARPDLAAIQTGFGGNTNSKNIAPVFASTTDLHLVPASNTALNNLGTPITGITTDIDGETRSTSTPDMGADEFNSSVLPVTLLEFRGEKLAKANKLSWSTANEQNNAGFELQRSANGTSFSTIGQVASRAVNGSSTGPLQYGFDDIQPLNGANYYRLKQLDKDGRFTYSATVLLKGQKVTSVQLGVVYPNPVISVLQFSVAAPASRKVTFMVTDLSGRTVLSSLQQLAEGDNTIQLPVSKLSAGTYLLKAVCAEGCETTTAKFIKL